MTAIQSHNKPGVIDLGTNHLAGRGATVTDSSPSRKGGSGKNWKDDWPRPLDTLHFFDNASQTQRLIFKDEAGETTVNDAALYERLRQEFAL